MQKLKRKNRQAFKNYINYAILAVALILAVLSFYSFSLRPFKTEILSVRFIVDKNIGLDLNSSELNFGRISPGGSVVKKVATSNDYSYPVKVDIFVSKSLAGFLSVDSSFLINPKDSIKIPVTLKLPEDIAFGNYTGKIRFEFRKIKT